MEREVAGGAAVSASVRSGIMLRALGARLDRIEPRARSRVLAFVALLPLVVAVLVVSAVLLPHPWLGLPDHCIDHDDAHLHLCLVHGAPLPSLLVMLLAGVVALRVLSGVLVEGTRALRASWALRRICRAPGPSTGELVRLPLEAPVAFTARRRNPTQFGSPGSPRVGGSGRPADYRPTRSGRFTRGTCSTGAPLNVARPIARSATCSSSTLTASSSR